MPGKFGEGQNEIGSIVLALMMRAWQEGGAGFSCVLVVKAL
jgi:hypothetical protein